MRTILIATHNTGKKKEIEQMLSGLDIEVKTLDDLAVSVDEPKETGATYEENALIKAKAAGDTSGLLTLADDSGLEVNVLPGELGVQSARYALGTDADRNNKLLTALNGNLNRRAKFVCCMVLYDPSTKTHQTCIGELRGRIAEHQAGAEGFGYDPVFIPDGYDKTNAQLGLVVKNTISHRSKALKQVREALL